MQENATGESYAKSHADRSNPSMQNSQQQQNETMNLNLNQDSIHEDEMKDGASEHPSRS